ncbi:UNVERIFIED_CONTAM: hypothetical protein PYX00_003296 [Menopon gallinae]|uniref:2-oxoisovalerate dehydrogenase subunit alpha n=1 Tax=Menopon gallinae TaxID=328185 RepID=A0AAW2HZH4_9NEOP
MFQKFNQNARFSTAAGDKLIPVPVSDDFYTEKLNLITPEDTGNIQAYRIMSLDGTHVSDTSVTESIPKEKIMKMYQDMVTLNVMDNILYESQRQGRISFYMTNYGEEACQIGSAAALADDDLIFAQYREAGVLLYRGFTLDDFLNQCYGNEADKGKGRQMPVHYGSRELNFVTISSPLGTQLPQAVGAAYAFKMKGKKACVVTYFGEGAASEGDAHGAFNFAVTLNCPVIFFCRNNGYAISTPANEQYGGNGLAARGLGYGLAAIRVDGNDIFAVYNATKVAKEYAIRENRGIVIEAMTYRIGHHSTSDDSSTYRPKEEVDEWNQANNPITRLKTYITNKGWWNDTNEKEIRNIKRKEVLKAMSSAEKRLKPEWKELFHDVYHDIPDHIRYV